MVLRDALNRAFAALSEAHTPSPRLNAETLLMFALGRDRAFLYAHPEYELATSEQRIYDDAIAQRARGVPAQYITGRQEFWGLDLLVSPAVLIPRPETEHVVERALEIAKARHNPRIVDVGTGSGCIALALAHEMQNAEIYATDISEDALNIARQNAARLGLERVMFKKSDLLSVFASEPIFDVVVSNPPYIAERDADSLEAQVRKFEPRLALFAGEDGLNAYRALIPQVLERLRPGGWLVMEIGAGQDAAVRELLQGWAEVEIRADVAGIARVISARRA